MTSSPLGPFAMFALPLPGRAIGFNGSRFAARSGLDATVQIAEQDVRPIFSGA